MASCTFLTTLLLATSITIASDVPFTCDVRSGLQATGIGQTSTVSCGQGETMVSCGIKGWEGIGGSWMIDNVCTALSNYDEFQVVAEARCCIFPTDAIISTSIAASGSAQSVSTTCACNEVLTGCQVYYTSGDYNKVRGSFAGPFTTTPQTTSWIPTDNQCNAASFTGGNVRAGATCLTVKEGYTLDCTTKAAYTTKDGFGSCDNGYTMMACNTFTDAHSLDAYYIHKATKGDSCYIQQDGWLNMYANVICCRLSSYKSTPIDSNPFDCGCNDNCTINCDDIDPHKGCANAIIDARKVSSLNVICSSSLNDYFGGCQFATIYCPDSSDSQCNIECNDYYGCYHTTIHASINQNVSIKCMDEEGSCLKSVLYANTTANVDISCYGSGILGSKMHSSCDNFEIHINDLSDRFNLYCNDDYSCYNMYIYANNAKYIYVHARGDMALSSSYIHAIHAGKLDLFCGSEESEYGCYKLYIYNPEYQNVETPRTSIMCQGHGCYDGIYTYSEHGALDVDVSLNGCGECNDIASCISNWYFYCYSTSMDTFHGVSCESDTCDCSYAVNLIKNNWINSMEECDIFTYDYECESQEDCVINCMEEWPNDNGCYDKAINGQNATSLHVICNSTSTNAIYGACESVHIYCPLGDNTQCDVECSNKDACYDTEISVNSSVLDLTCKNKDSCSHTNVYSGINAEISISCIDTDACDNINVTANNARNITIHCQGNQDFESYSACDGFIIWAENVTNAVQLICTGDYSCYSIDIHANYANNVIVDTVGNYGSYGGHIYASNSNSMLISCKSEFGGYGCYKMAFYIPSGATTLHCEGNGCHYLQLMAPHGFADLTDISVNGCDECSDITACISYWEMNCGLGFATQNTLVNSICTNTNCGCTSTFLNTLTSAWINDKTQCNLIASDYECTAGFPCTIDCIIGQGNSCSKDVIVGGSATSLEVVCDENLCAETKIYCPSTHHSDCIIRCVGDKACYNAEIFGESSSNLVLQCNGYDSCSHIEMDISDTLLTNVTCDLYGACSNIELFGDNAIEIIMNCIGQNTGYGEWDYYYYYDDWNATHDYQYHTSVCDQIRISAKNAKKVELRCVGNDACYPDKIDMENTQNAFIYGIGSYSIYGGSIHAQNTEVLWLQFEGGDKYGVEDVDIYVPPNDKTSLNCKGYGCHDLNLYTKNGMMDVHNISFDTCGQCVKPETCITDWNLYCGDGYAESTTFTGSFCEENECQCFELKANIEEAFIADIERDMDVGHCNDDRFVADIECPEGKACLVDCEVQDCINKEIYGAKALSLTVKCDGQFVCNALQMYCPETPNSQCNLLCNGFDACWYTTLYGDHHNVINIEATQQYAFEGSTIYGYDAIEVNVNCTNTEACYDSSIYASKAKSVNVICYDDGIDDSEYEEYHWYYYSFWNYTSTSPCYGLNIYASAVQNDIQLTCKGDYACYTTNLYADDAKHVVIRGDNGEYAMKDANIYASNVTQFELKCTGTKKEHGCSSSHIYLPDNPTITCYGLGCYELYLYTKHGVRSSTVQVNSCDACRELGKCIYGWFLYCDLWSEYDLKTVYDGAKCGSLKCGCQTLAAAIVFSTETSCDSLISDKKHGHHHIIQVTDRYDNPISPGNTMAYPHMHSHYTHGHVMLFFMVCIVLIVVCCIVGNVVYCYKRKVNEKIAEEILHQADEGGLNEIALEPMDENMQEIIVTRVENKANANSKRKYVKMDDERPRDGGNTGSMGGGITTWSYPK